MLVLARKAEESVVVGEGPRRLLKVTVLEIRNGIVKLGFEADEDIPVHRSEVWERIAAQNWGPSPQDRNIPNDALAETLLRPRRKQKKSPAIAGQIGAHQTHPDKRAT